MTILFMTDNLIQRLQKTMKQCKVKGVRIRWLFQREEFQIKIEYLKSLCPEYKTCESRVWGWNTGGSPIEEKTVLTKAILSWCTFSVVLSRSGWEGNEKVTKVLYFMKVLVPIHTNTFACEWLCTYSSCEQGRLGGHFENVENRCWI